MTANDILMKDKDKPSVSIGTFSFCEICESNGYPNEKVVYHYQGMRSEDEEGFITRFTVYDYPIQAGKIHVHKYNDELINRLVNKSLGKVKA